MDKEKLSTEFDEWDLFLERITSKEDEFVGSEPPHFDIVKPGCYILTGKRQYKPIDELKKAWARLTANEREAFIAGIQAPPPPYQYQHGDIF